MNNFNDKTNEFIIFINNSVLNWKILKNSDKIDVSKVFFGTPLSYILAGQKYSDGQGDICEGLLMRLKVSDPRYSENKNKLKTIFGNDLIERVNRDGWHEFFSLKHLMTPTTCFFSANKSWFEHNENYNFIPITDRVFKTDMAINLSSKLFLDFVNTKNDKKKYFYHDLKIINYGTIENYVGAIYDGLNNMGIKNGIFELDKIKYTRHKNLPWILPEINQGIYNPDIPMELFYKDSKFSYQNEMRGFFIHDDFKYPVIYCFSNNIFYHPIPVSLDFKLYIQTKEFDSDFQFENNKIIDKKNVTIKFSLIVKEQWNMVSFEAIKKKQD